MVIGESGQMVDTINVKGMAHKIGGNQADGQWFRKQATVFTSQTWTTSGVRTFNVSNYLPDNDYVYEVVVSSYSTSAATAGSWDTWWVRNQDAQFDQYMSRNITRTASNVLCGESAIIPVQQVNGVLTLNINVTNTGTAGAGLYLMGYRRLGGVKPKTYYALTVNPTPSDATVTFNKGTVVGNTCTVTAGTSVTYTVSKSGYETQSGTVTVNSNQTVNVSLSQAGIPMYGYVNTYNGTTLDGYLLGEMTTNAYCAMGTNNTSGKITSITGTIGASGSKVVPDGGYTLTYDRKITVSGIDLFIYKIKLDYGLISEIAVKSDAAVGKNYISGALVGIVHPSSANSSSFTASNLTFNRKSSLDYIFTGS